MSKRARRLVLALAAGVLLAVGGSGCARTTTPSSAAAASGDLTSRVRRLGQIADAQQRRIDDLEMRQAALEARLRDLHGGSPVSAAGRRSPAAVAATTSAGRSASGSGERDGAGAEPATSSEVEDVDQAIEELPDHDAGADRPLLRIYGSTASSQSTGPVTPDGLRPPQAPVQVPPPIVPPGLPGLLPAAPVPLIPVIPDSPTAPMPGDPPPEPGLGASAPSSPEVAEYRAALALLRERRFDRALGALGEFLQRHPLHPYADNALYWRGEALYAMRRYREAIHEFTRVVTEFPRGNKVADALLKIGLSFARLGDAAQARSFFSRVRRDFPDTDAARMAAREDTR